MLTFLNHSPKVGVLVANTQVGRYGENGSGLPTMPLRQDKVTFPTRSEGAFQRRHAEHETAWTPTSEDASRGNGGEMNTRREMQCREQGDYLSESF